MCVCADVSAACSSQDYLPTASLAIFVTYVYHIAISLAQMVKNLHVFFAEPAISGDETLQVLNSAEPVTDLFTKASTGHSSVL